MAAPMVKKVRVEMEVSDSASESDSLESIASSDDNAADADNSEEEGTEQVESPTGKSGLADVLAKILHKNVPVHKQVILAKGKTDKEIRKRKLERELAEEEAAGKKTKQTSATDGAESYISREEKLKIWENMCRSKPDPLERDRERQLQKIATRGVVQLFNAVRKQQKDVDEKIQQVGGSERKKEKVMEGMTRDKFLSILKGTSNTNVKNDTVEKRESKTKVQNKHENNEDNKDSDKKWDILKEDYMMGAKMKDWGQEGDDDESDDDDDSGPDDPDLSDSD